MISEKTLSEIENIIEDISDAESIDTTSEIEYLKYIQEDTSYCVSRLEDIEISSHDYVKFDDPWVSSYGVDAGSSRPIFFGDGEIVNFGVSSTGIVGESPDKIESDTVTTMLHSRSRKYNINTDSEDVYISQLPSVDRHHNKDLADWIESTSMAKAQAIQGLKTVKKSDCPLFIDGPVFPGQCIYYLLGYKSESKINPYLDWKNIFNSIMQKRIKTIEKALEKNQIIAGFVKKPRSNSLTSTIQNNLEDDNINFMYDEGLLSSAFEKEREYGSDLVMTNWFFKKYNLRRDDPLILLRDMDGIELKHKPIDYQMTFFYLTIPESSIIIRVEMPKIMFDRNDENKIKRKLVSEIVSSKDVPQSVKLSDSRSRLTNNTSSDLLDSLPDSLKNYNNRKR